MSQLGFWKGISMALSEQCCFFSSAAIAIQSTTWTTQLTIGIRAVTGQCQWNLRGHRLPWDDLLKFCICTLATVMYTYIWTHRCHQEIKGRFKKISIVFTDTRIWFKLSSINIQINSEKFYPTSLKDDPLSFCDILSMVQIFAFSADILSILIDNFHQRRMWCHFQQPDGTFFLNWGDYHQRTNESSLTSFLRLFHFSLCRSSKHRSVWAPRRASLFHGDSYRYSPLAFLQSTQTIYA